MSRKSTLNEGFDLLDKTDRVSIDPDVKELSEPLNLRTSDPLDLVLGEILRSNPGGYISNKQYSIEVPGSSYPTDLTFDRFYWNQNLLVDFVNLPTNEYQKETVEKGIAEKRALATRQGLRYLAIVGSATFADIKAALAV